MAIFSRRTIQRSLNENAKFLTKSQTRNHVQQLNNLSIDLTLAYEWEVVLLNALSKIGRVEHEKSFGGNRKGDIYFETYDNPNNNFLADITAVSTKGIDKKVPHKALSNKLTEIVRGHGLNPNSFRYEINRHTDPEMHSYKSLKLPGSARFRQTIFNDKFEEFICEIKKNPKTNQSYKINTHDVDVIISYNPNQEFASGSFTYGWFYDLAYNTLYQALERKRVQLAGTKYKGPFGIFLCDGGFDSFNPAQVIKDYLAHHNEIYFIVAFTIKTVSSLSHHTRSLVVELYKGLNFDQIQFDINEIIIKLHAVFPIPDNDPINALHYLEWAHAKGRPFSGRSLWGGWQLSHRDSNRVKIRFSARGLLNLLAGTVEFTDFLEAHRFDKNPFKYSLEHGLLIEKAYIEKVNLDDDDEWIVFELKGPDPAISPFTAPTLAKK